MKPKNDRIEQLFDSANQAPTELSQSEMEAMIRGFNLVDTEPNVKPKSTLFFNLKNIIIMSIPISIAIGFFLFSPIQNGAEKLKSKSEFKTEKSEQLKEEKIDDATINNTSKIEVNELREVSNSSTVILDKSMESVKKRHLNTEKKADKKSAKEQPGREENSSKSQKAHSNKFGAKLEFQAPQDSPAPHLSNFKMLRIKRNLYRNLQKDNFIVSKNVFVEIDLLGTGIIVNGVEMNNAMFLKYSGITEDAGTGANRKIKMNRQYIKIGDFNPDGFKGSAFGKFRANYSLKDDGALMPNMDSDTMGKLPDVKEIFSNEKEKKKALLDEELKGRDAFASGILAESPRERGRSRLFSPNLRHKEMKALHAELYRQLIIDSLLTSKDDFALLELNKKQILVNGQVLSTKRFQTYSNLISEFKIKFLPSRQIRLSAHTIAVGDYGIGSFSGSMTSFEFE